MNTQEDLKEQNSPSCSGRRFFAFAMLAALAIIILRRPDAILNPQFWAEDGRVFYADAYNKGLIIPFYSPCGGYLDTFPRLIAAFSQLLPLSWAPLLFNLAALAVKVLPVGLVLSSRFCELIPDFRTRLFLAFLYLALPNSWEINAGPLHGKTYLSLLTFMILSASPGSKLISLFFDVGIVLLTGLSGPFCIVLAPIAAIFWLRRRDKRSLLLFVLIGICAIIQTTVLIAGPGRPQRLLGAAPKLFVEILVTQVFLGAMIGYKGLLLISQRVLLLISHFSTLYTLFMIVFSILGLVSLIRILLRSPLELRLFVLYGLLLFVAALFLPLGKPNEPQWPLLLIPGVGGRYWFIPMLAFISVLVWLSRRSASRLSKALAAAVFSIMIIGIILDWRHPAFKDFNFRELASRLESAPIGAQVTIPINPSGWSITLIKH